MPADSMITPDFIPQVDPLRFELRGSHLIEASAGTGKTWTIAALYVRLVLGHGGQPPRLPSQILVLTFTDAAAQELRDRIRSRLSEAAVGFSAAIGQDAPEPLPDPFLQDLRAAHPAERWPACARVLDLAAQSMDEASISTIHAWCARVLKEHAFDSANLFEQELLTDLRESQRQVAWDYWRACVARLPAAALDDVLGIWPGPDALDQSLSRLLTREGLPDMGEDDLEQVWSAASAERRAQLLALKAPWPQAVDELQAWLDAQGNQVSIRADHRGGWLQALRDWAASPDLEKPALSPTAWKVLAPQGLDERWKGAGPAPEPPAASRALSRLQADLDSLPAVRLPVQRHALAWMAARLRQLLARKAAMGFDGLLTGLDAALRGMRGEPLIRTLREQFPVVLIDEFQDTDPVQYRIFDRIYDVADPAPETALIFIGDPKQAIYGFRGADVHTYLQAARACDGRVQTLNRNHRSSTALVQAVNHCFDRHEAPAVFPTGLADETIAFHPVQARGRAESWEIDGQAPSAMTARWIDTDPPGGTLTVDAYCAQAAEWCARQVADLLELGHWGRAGFRSDCGLTAVQPADMAILVNGKDEAWQIREALSRQGVRSVYLSDRRSVYASAVAQELVFILAACVHPEDEQAIRAALATPLLGLDVARLAMLGDDEWAWDGQVERFQSYHQRWRQRGVLPMLRQLLHDFEVPARLLAQGPDGERLLTDCLHLAELLQQASAQLDGEQAVLHYLARQCATPDDDADAEDARRLRLESDENLVRVITIHKSKGLEYPLVFLPFICRGRAARLQDRPHLLTVDGERQWVMQANDAQRRQLLQEQLGEETRKLYVALTRARHAVWLALAVPGKDRVSGIGHVLGEDLRLAWSDRVAAHPDEFAWDPSQPADAAGSTARQEDISDDAADLGPARLLAVPAVRHPWWVASYSALHPTDAQIGSAGSREASPETASEDVLREGRRVVDVAGWPPEPDVPLAASDGLSGALSGLPRGSETGTFLHGLLEWAAQRRFRYLDGARDLIARRCAVRGWEAHIDTLHAWLLDFVQTAWTPRVPGGPVLRLDRLRASLPEMEFWLPVAQVWVTRLDQLITQATFDAAPRPALAEDRLNGLFKGFIDLCLQGDDGRYYLIDYKSNDLGARPSDYRPSALQAAMCAARYDVQLVMYVLALHRQLRTRLPDYDYERDMGGAIYLFLRGRMAPGQGLLSLRPPPSLIEDLDALFAGQEAAAHD